MSPIPSRLKIALLSAGISGIVLIAFGTVMWTLVRDMRIEVVDREIRTLASRHPGLFAGRGNYDRLTEWLEFTFGDDYTNHAVLLIRSADGQTRYASPHWPNWLDPDRIGGEPPDSAVPPATPLGADDDRSPPEPGVGRPGLGHGDGAGWGPPAPVVFARPARFWTEKSRESAWRLGLFATDQIKLIIGINQREADHELNHVRTAFLATLPAALFLVGLGGWIVAGRALRPLKAIADTAEQVTASGLDQRIADSGDSPEAGRVIQVLNRMMDRLEASFRQATRFSADASHELKTPLAVMQGELENALHRAMPGSTEQQFFSELLEETQRLNTITRSLLLLAQADAGQLKLALETVDLSTELEPMIDDARAMAKDRDLAFEASVAPHLHVKADRALLHTALFNLINNALKFNEPGGSLALRLGSAEDKIQFTVGNSGPGIPTADQPRVFDRFYRAGREGSARIEGIGLGLSLAREIIRAHGGELLLKESRPGWTCFAVHLDPLPLPGTHPSPASARS